MIDLVKITENDKLVNIVKRETSLNKMMNQTLNCDVLELTSFEFID